MTRSVVDCLIILAASRIFAIPQTVHSAKLLVDLKFRSTHIVILVQGLANGCSAIILAAAGFGASALIWPVLVTSVVGAVGCRALAGPIPLGLPRFSELWPLMTTAAWTTPSHAIRAIHDYGTVFLVGLLCSKQITGTYYLAWLIASQATVMLATNFRNILFPALNRVRHDRKKAQAAIADSFDTLLILCGPICVLQALCAGPVIRSFFPANWHDSVPAIVWLSAGLHFFPIGVVAHATLLSLSRLGQLALLSIASTTATLLGASTGSLAGSVAAIGAGVGIGAVIAGAIAIGALARASEVRTMHFARTALKQLGASTLAGLAGYSVKQVANNLHLLLQLSLIAAIVVSTYTVLCTCLMRSESLRALNHLRGSFRLTTKGR